jgi:hypothetical protein
MNTEIPIHPINAPDRALRAALELMEFVSAVHNQERTERPR